jgi:hypothetical protein
MDSLNTIGTILTTETDDRDAIHIAVLSAVAGERLRPGEQVALSHGTSNVAIRALDEYGQRPSIGIVDPFIGTRQAASDLVWEVKKGQRFWLFLHPNSVTGMRHHWQHPLVDTPAAIRSDAELWLRRFAERWGFDYDGLLETTLHPQTGRYENYVVAVGRALHHVSELGEDHALFWQHLSTLTGRTFDQAHQDKVIWTCTC